MSPAYLTNQSEGVNPPALVAGPIIGHRGWRLSKDGLLTSLNFNVRWPPHTPHYAICHGDSFSSLLTSLCGEAAHHSPILICNCGIYAYKVLQSDWDDVEGEVALWGRVIEHTHGYRAEYAYPIRFWPNPSKWRVSGWWGRRRMLRRLEEVGRRYGCPVQPPPAEALQMKPLSQRLKKTWWLLLFQIPVAVWNLVEGIKGFTLHTPFWYFTAPFNLVLSIVLGWVAYRTLSRG